MIPQSSAPENVKATSVNLSKGSKGKSSKRKTVTIIDWPAEWRKAGRTWIRCSNGQQRIDFQEILARSSNTHEEVSWAFTACSYSETFHAHRQLRWHREKCARRRSQCSAPHGLLALLYACALGHEGLAEREMNS